MIEHGTVESYNSEHKVGFVTPDGQEKPIFFQLGGRKKVVIERDQVGFGESSEETKKLAVPKRGSRMVFTTTKSKRGRKVDSWALELPYEMAIGRLHKMPWSRVVRIIVLSGKNPVQFPAEVLDTGKDVEFLKEKFPRVGTPPVPEKVFNATKTTSYHLETQQPDGTWPGDEETEDSSESMPSSEPVLAAA